MWRSLFMALGIFSILLGLEAMVVDQVVMSRSRRLPKILDSRNPGVNVVSQGYPSSRQSAYATPSYQYQYNPYQQASYGTNTTIQPSRLVQQRVVTTKDWMPWSLLAAGAIIVLYTSSLPKNGRAFSSSE